MAVPDFQTMMLPFLAVAGDGHEHTSGGMAESLAGQYQLTESEKTEMVPSGRQTRLMNRIYWISTHFKNARLIESSRRGAFKITDRGNELLKSNPASIDLKTLQRYPEYIKFRNKKGSKETIQISEEKEVPSSKTPDELLFDSYRAIRETLASDLLEKLKSCTPSFFERIVVELLVSMGYGGTLEDAGSAVGKSGDGGIDGIIKEDRLGLDVIYLQAKRWEATVGRPELQAFAGALLGKQARKGVFITTSNFSSGAKSYVDTITSNIILIDGEQMAELMIDYNVGVSVAATYEIKKIDSDYFIEE